MAIVILEQRIENNPGTFEPESRGVTIWISDGSDHYITQRGNLPLTGDLLPGLLADEAAIWNDAVQGGQLATKAETATADRLQYMINNPNAKAIFDLSATDVDVQISALVDAIIPTATAANRTKLKRVLTVGILVNRESVAGD